MIDVEKIQIVNYCHKNCVPLKNIMRLPKEEAYQLAFEMAKNNEGSTAFGRFADFEKYYPERMNVDRILYNSFVSLGGKPQNEHPLSFVLQGSEYLYQWFDKGYVTKIPLMNVPSDSISFTFGDSMATLKRTGKVEMIPKQELLESVRSYEGTLEEFINNINKQYGYVEVQLWNDKYCRK